MRTKLKLAILICILSLGMLVGCTKNSVEGVSGQVKSNETFKNEDVSIASQDLDYIKGHTLNPLNQLGLTLMTSMSEENSESNQLLSPISLGFALAMLQNGGVGATKEGILKVLGIEEKGLNEDYHKLMKYLMSLDQPEGSQTPGVRLTIGNSLWFRKDLDIQQSFVDTLSQSYNAQVYLKDFSKQETLSEMNLWVEEQTNHLLKNTIRNIDANSIALLMNTVYFKGTWKEAFNKAFTEEKEFELTDSNKIMTQMMFKKDDLPYYEDEVCQVTNLQYYGDTSMSIILPKMDVDEFLQSMTYEVLEQFISEAQKNHVQVELSLPKLDYEVSNPLNDVLTDLGMERAFSKKDADFSSIAIVQGENVFISSVFQNARIIVDEEGTEAAAVTVVEVEATSAEPPSDTMVLNCNKPFLYLIREKETGALLFMGVVKAP